jgi:signal transduction histidine kinase
MSHELRTPLNAIIGYAGLLREEAQDDGADSVADLRRIETAGRHLLELINGILDLSKIEAGKMEVHFESVRVADVIENVVTSVDPVVRQRGNDFVVEQAQGVGELVTDRAKLRQVLINLLANSAKFTENGVVTLRVHDGGREVCFAVSDTGIGMTDEQCARIFEPFAQATSETSKKFGGTGLGLTLSARFCELMGGSLRAESTLGQGSVFRAVLPRRMEATP